MNKASRYWAAIAKMFNWVHATPERVIVSQNKPVMLANDEHIISTNERERVERLARGSEIARRDAIYMGRSIPYPRTANASPERKETPKAKPEEEKRKPFDDYDPSTYQNTGSSLDFGWPSSDSSSLTSDYSSNDSSSDYSGGGGDFGGGGAGDDY